MYLGSVRASIMHCLLCLQAVRKVTTDPLGTPLFEFHMAAAGLPLTAELRSVNKFTGDSITDQVWVAQPYRSWTCPSTCLPLFEGAGTLLVYSRPPINAVRHGWNAS